MRTFASLLLVGALTGSMGLMAQPVEEPVPSYRPVGTMSELMAKIVHPTSDAIFYIAVQTPPDQEGWNTLQGQALMLAESANILMMPSRARDRDQWMRDSKLLLDAGEAAFEAAKKQDVSALEALNDQLYQSCVQCHKNYRPDYGRRHC